MKILLLALITIGIFCVAMAGAATIHLPKTGQSKCYDAAGNEIACAGSGQDGALQKGADWPNPRFSDNGNGTVTDNVTGLIWLRDANCFGSQTWQTALNSANSLASGDCGLTDGSKVGDWRLPNYRELSSVVNDAVPNPATWLSTQGFTAVQANFYWSSSTFAYLTYSALGVGMFDGKMGQKGKASISYVWPVRTGQSGPFVSLVISPTSKEFGNINTSAFSSPQTFTISNSGNAGLTISSIALLSGDSSQFFIDKGNCGFAPTLAAGGSCNVSATFAPTSVGAKATTLRIVSNDPANLTKVAALSGTGVIPSYTINTSVVGGNGNINCSSPAIKGASSICTITPDYAFHLTTFTDNSTDKLASVTSNSYTISNVQADHSIVGSFSDAQIAVTITNSETGKLFAYTGAKLTLNFTAPANTPIADIKAAITANSWIPFDLSKLKFSKGKGSLPFTITANADPMTRSGQITIGSDAYNLTQAAHPCAIKTAIVSPLTTPAAGGDQSVTVTVEPAACQWKVVSYKTPRDAWFSTAGSFPIAEVLQTGSTILTGTVGQNTTKRARTNTVVITTLDGKSKKSITLKQSGSGTTAFATSDINGTWTFVFKALGGSSWSDSYIFNQEGILTSTSDSDVMSGIASIQVS